MSCIVQCIICQWYQGLPIEKYHACGVIRLTNRTLKVRGKFVGARLLTETRKYCNTIASEKAFEEYFSGVPVHVDSEGVLFFAEEAGREMWFEVDYRYNVKTPTFVETYTAPQYESSEFRQIARCITERRLTIGQTVQPEGNLLGMIRHLDRISVPACAIHQFLREGCRNRECDTRRLYFPSLMPQFGSILKDISYLTCFYDIFSHDSPEVVALGKAIRDILPADSIAKNNLGNMIHMQKAINYEFSASKILSN